MKYLVAVERPAGSVVVVVSTTSSPVSMFIVPPVTVHKSLVAPVNVVSGATVVIISVLCKNGQSAFARSRL